jgi:Cu+-exporting ATPase
VRQTERGYLLEILLRKHAAVKDVRVVADIGSVTVHYDPAQLAEERLLAIADAVIGNLASAPPPRATSRARRGSCGWPASRSARSPSRA